MDRNSKITLLKALFTGKTSIDESMKILFPKSIVFSFKRVSPVTRCEIAKGRPDVFYNEKFKDVTTGEVLSYDKVIALSKEKPNLVVWHLVHESKQLAPGISEIIIQRALRLSPEEINNLSSSDKLAMFRIWQRITGSAPISGKKEDDKEPYKTEELNSFLDNGPFRDAYKLHQKFINSL